MRSLAVVVLHIRSERAASLTGGRIRLGVRPLSEQRLNETLRLAVRAGCIGPCPKMPKPQAGTGGTKQSGHVAAAVIAHHPARRDAAPGKPGDGPLDEGGTLAPS